MGTAFLADKRYLSFTEIIVFYRREGTKHYPFNWVILNKNKKPGTITGHGGV
jgi:hypothetical protein